MYIKGLGVAIFLAISLLTSSSFADSRSMAESFASMDTSRLPNGSIVVIKEEKSDSPGYVHTQYAFVDQACGAIFVDKYGPPVNPDDRELKQVEQRMCTEIAMNSRDGD